MDIQRKWRSYLPPHPEIPSPSSILALPMSDQQASSSDIPGADRVVRSLSRREVVILRTLTEGASNKIIARKLVIAESTVKVHVKAILRKLRLHNRTQAAMGPALTSLAQTPRPFPAISPPTWNQRARRY